jgi:hypothetical protein
MNAQTGYLIEAEDYAKLQRMADRLCGGSDKMRDEGNALWLILARMVPWADELAGQELDPIVMMRLVPPEDTPTIENCDDCGTGEGRYHGRM